MFGYVFEVFSGENTDVKMGKSGKAGGGGHSIVESGEQITESVRVLNSFL
jgi:hypothetical protein